MRAALMYSLWVLFAREGLQSQSVHGLALAAWVLLTLGPDSLFDVGFHHISFLELFHMLKLILVVNFHLFFHKDRLSTISETRLSFWKVHAMKDGTISLSAPIRQYA